MSEPPPIDRRRFLTRPFREPVVVRLSCERLYVRYLDALGSDRVAAFVTELAARVRAADEVVLTERDWLARDDFRQAIESALRGGDAVPPGAR